MNCLECGSVLSENKCGKCGFNFTSESFVFFGDSNSCNAVLDKYCLAFQKEIKNDNSFQEWIRELEQEVKSLKKQLQAAEKKIAETPTKGNTSVAKTASMLGAKDSKKQNAKPADSHIEYARLRTQKDLYNALAGGGVSFIMGQDYQLRPNCSGLVYLEAGEKKINQMYDNAELTAKNSIKRYRAFISCFLILSVFDRTKFRERFTYGKILNKDLTKLFASYLIEESLQNDSLSTSLIQAKRNNIVEDINREALKNILEKLPDSQRFEFEQLRDKEAWGIPYLKSKGEWRKQIMQAMYHYTVDYLKI